jgi:hypothetical protein
MKGSAYPVGLVLASILVGCSGKPSETDAQNLFEDQLPKEFCKLIRFAKTNAQSSEQSGVKMYTVEYEAEVEYLKDCMKNSMNRIVEDPGMAPTGCTRFKKGQRDLWRGLLTFGETEKGWKGTNGKIY